MTSSSLSPRAQAVIQRAREGLLPGAGDRERIEALLDVRLAPTALASEALSWRFFSVSAWRLALGLVVLGGAAFLVLNAAAPPAPTTPAAPAFVRPAAIAPSLPAIEPLEVVVPQRTAAVVAVDSATRREAPVSAVQTPDYLAQEVALLSSATHALRAGRAEAALQLLNEHQRKFPTGFLSVERRTAKAQALCSLKRMSEGRAELALLTPASPAAARARQVCDARAAKNDP